MKQMYNEKRPLTPERRTHPREKIYNDSTNIYNNHERHDLDGSVLSMLGLSSLRNFVQKWNP